MGTHTAEETKQGYITKMGPKLGAQYAELWQEVASVHMKWLEYLELYGTNNSRIEILNQAAPRFFRMVQDVMWEDIVLHVARLMDASRGVLTIRNTPKIIDDASVKKNVQSLVTDAARKTEFCKDWRDRHIAHRNLELATNSTSVRPLKPLSKGQIDEALDSIAAVLNVVSSHFRNSETFFRFNSLAGGAESLLYVLDSGVRAEAARLERLKSGEATKDDYHARQI